ncbi:leucine efflux protein LeuE [Paractinoplanes toevensis]|uniref:Leucine efflux protein n=1 Tax=Paractinoplanes toevensis TaxID=571911 RepID=A0A919W0N0_9ACTN|nr:leucine efflux protein LeuE [Actinoplanes toevensis]GIM89419.1 leucine efflux protein [Actinoplanes toevensis]
MLGITDFWTYVLGSAAIILLPGPNSIFVLSVGARRGVRAGYRAAAGVFLGDTVLMTLSAAGVASLLRTYPPLFLVIKYAGAAYLLWVGLGIIRGALRRLRQRSSPTAGSVGAANRAGAGTAEAGARQMSTAEADTRPAGSAAEPSDLRHPFRRAAVISLLNPKAILFFVSFFIQFVEPGYPHPALSFLVLGAVVQLFSSLYLTALIFGGKFLAGQFRRRRKLAAGAATGVGALFVGFGIKLATASIG